MKVKSQKSLTGDLNCAGDAAYIASKWNLWASCSFSSLSSRRSLRWSPRMISIMIKQMPSSANTLLRMILLGVTKSWIFHIDGWSSGAGITKICELGIVCGHLRLFFDNPISMKSTKFGVLPRPKIV